MSHEELKKVGTKVDECDNYDGSIYLGTTEFWYYNNVLYVHQYHSNLNRYTGETATGIICTKSDLDKYGDEYFLDFINLSENGLKKFKELAK